MWELGGLFLSALLSATILPGSSEVVLVAILGYGIAAPLVAVLVATVGNAAGSMINWGMGRFISDFKSHPKFPLSEEKYDRYAAWFQKYGVWTLFLSWVPLIGDGLTLVAGMLRAHPLLVLVIVFLAKGARYLIVAGATVALL